MTEEEMKARDKELEEKFPTLQDWQESEFYHPLKNTPPHLQCKWSLSGIKESLRYRPDNSTSQERMLEKDSNVIDLEKKYPTIEAWRARENYNTFQEVPLHLREELVRLQDWEKCPEDSIVGWAAINKELDKNGTPNWSRDSSEDIEDGFLVTYRLEALKLAMEMAIKINFFQDKYESGKNGLLQDIDVIHEVAAYHVKFLLGEK